MYVVRHLIASHSLVQFRSVPVSSPSPSPHCRWPTSAFPPFSEPDPNSESQPPSPYGERDPCQLQNNLYNWRPPRGALWSPLRSPVPFVEHPVGFISFTTRQHHSAVAKQHSHSCSLCGLCSLPPVDPQTLPPLYSSRTLPASPCSCLISTACFPRVPGPIQLTTIAACPQFRNMPTALHC